MDPDLKELVKILLESENNLTLKMQELAVAADIRQARTDTAMEQLTLHLDQLTANVDAYVKSADAYVSASQERMTLVEKQLDALVRALTTKATNGKAE